MKNLYEATRHENATINFQQNLGKNYLSSANIFNGVRDGRKPF
jgi:hypothetical protein